MRSIERTGRFKRDYKQEKKTDQSLDAVFVPILELLAADVQLPESLRDHGLTGPWEGYRDCHVKPDLVLIYEKASGVLRLARLGSYSELFG